MVGQTSWLAHWEQKVGGQLPTLPNRLRRQYSSDCSQSSEKVSRESMDPYRLALRKILFKRPTLSILYILLCSVSLFILSYFMGQMSTKHGYVNYIILPRYMECRCGIAMRILSVCLSVHQMCGYCDKREEKYV